MKQNTEIKVIHRIHKGSKKIYIKILDENKIVVARPSLVPLEESRKFLQSKEKWIYQQLALFKEKNLMTKQFTKRNIVFTEKNKQTLKDRTFYLAKKYNFPINRCTIRKQKTRWGSCSSKNNINLNIKLLHFPIELIDYVIMHELVHTKIKNHQPEFWQELAKFVPNPKLKNDYLRKFNLRLL